METLRLVFPLVGTAVISFYDYAPGKKKNFVNGEEKKRNSADDPEKTKTSDTKKRSLFVVQNISNPEALAKAVIFGYTILQALFGQSTGFKPNPYVRYPTRYAHQAQQNQFNRNHPGGPALKGSRGWDSEESKQLGQCRPPRVTRASMDELSKQLSPTWAQYQKDYYPESAPKRYNIEKCSRRTFEKLANDTRVKGGQYNRISVDEARAIQQARKQGLVIKPTRTEYEIAKQVDLDFKVEGPNNYTHFDVKNPVGQDILDAQKQNKTIFQMATEIGEKITKQKTTFVGLKDGPPSPANVGYIVDLCYVTDPAEKIIVRDQIIKAAGNVTSSDIFFIND